MKKIPSIHVGHVLHPLRGQLKIAPIEEELRSGGLILTAGDDEDDPSSMWMRAEVLELGPDPIPVGATEPRPFDFEVGDLVALSPKGAALIRGGACVRETPDGPPIVCVTPMAIYAKLERIDE